MPTRNKKILLIDDEQDLSTLVAKRLQASGYEVITHHEGSAAVQLVIREMPTLILLDIKLPGIDGIEIFNKLRSQKLTQNIPVIFISALHEEEDTCLSDLKANGFLKKPFDAKQLLYAVDNVLNN